ncbi:MAG TPA: alpha/beta hydrolase-fold protein [Agriterribacter sp.]|nr:alpha/beta hydrolase-fold protein [Agriterribacter sp.]
MVRLKILLLAVWTLPAISVSGQHTVTITVTGVPAHHRQEPFFITGIFNRWNPGDSSRIMQQVSPDSYAIVLKNIPKGLFEYKFTRGNWTTLEATGAGRLVAPRKAIITSDTTIECTIPAWRDDFPASTASAQVHVLDSAFYIPQLKVYRKVWIYLPKAYAVSNERYPVLYMHDGQDLFDEATSAGRLGPLEWGVDEVMDSVQQPCIVVAIAHHEDKDGRLREYFVHPNADFPQVYGKAYLEFIVKNLKPFIDKKFRTQPGKFTTWMAGGSMGGLITLYAGLMYPDVFGSLGVMSPSIWQDGGHALAAIAGAGNKNAIRQQHYYFYAGDNENRIKPDGSRVQMHKDVEAAAALLKERADPLMKVVIYPAGRHGAWYWRLAFPALYEWISANR